MRIRGGKSLKQEEGRGCTEGERTSLKTDDRGGPINFSLLSPSLFPKVGLTYACTHPRWDAGILAFYVGSPVVVNCV